MNKVKYLLVFIGIFAANDLFAQAVVHAWASGADQRDLSFGFTFQYVSSDLKIIKKPDWRAPYYDPATGAKLTDSLNGISSRSSKGFALGFIARYRLTENLEARLTPMFVFADRLLEYEYNSGGANPLLNIKALPITPNILEQTVQTTSFEMPLSLKLKSDRLGNFRGYMLAGVKYTMLIAGNKETPNASPIDRLVLNSHGFASYEAGIGCDIYFDYFKLSPELKISNSFNNILVGDNTHIRALSTNYSCTLLCSASILSKRYFLLTIILSHPKQKKLISLLSHLL